MEDAQEDFNAKEKSYKEEYVCFQKSEREYIYELEEAEEEKG